MKVQWIDNHNGHAGEVEVPDGSDVHTVRAAIIADHAEKYPNCFGGNPLLAPGQNLPTGASSSGPQST